MPVIADLASRVTNSPGLPGTVPVFKHQEWLIPDGVDRILG